MLPGDKLGFASDVPGASFTSQLRLRHAHRPTLTVYVTAHLSVTVCYWRELHLSAAAEERQQSHAYRALPRPWHRPSVHRLRTPCTVCVWHRSWLLLVSTCLLLSATVCYCLPLPRNGTLRVGYLATHAGWAAISITLLPQGPALRHPRHRASAPLILNSSWDGSVSIYRAASFRFAPGEFKDGPDRGMAYWRARPAEFRLLGGGSTSFTLYTIKAV